MSHAPEQERAHGRHRTRRAGASAGAVTATIAAGSLALAAYATTATAGAPSGVADASVGQTAPVLAAETVAQVDPRTGVELGRAFAEARELRHEQGVDALTLSSDLSATGVSAVRDASKVITKQKKAERAAAEAAERAAAERAAAERAAAEQAAREAAERAAAERAAAERAAAEQAAAEQAAREAAERQAAERAAAETASRSAERQAAPQPAPAPAPVSSGDARSVARSMLGSYGWGEDQWGCLDSLWMRESGWSHTATNPSSGAYGIPQALPATKMSTAGSDWQTNPATQITWGLGYISDRYGSPCNAWAHSESVGWY